MPANGTEAATLSQIKEYVEYAIANQTPPTTDIDMDKIYPVGSIYMSMSLTSPSSLFGGTWQRIQSRYLMASDSTYTAGETGGNNDAVVVSHSHSASSEVDGGHSHSISGGSHSHSGTAKSAGSHSHSITNTLGCGWNPGGNTDRIMYNKYQSARGMQEFFSINTGGAHTHTVTVSTSSSHSHTISSNGDHAHNVNIFSSGSSGTNKNMPEFIAVNVWKRTA